jgi:hypothetical protein
MPAIALFRSVTLGCACLAAAEREKLARERGGAFAGVEDLVGEAAQRAGGGDLRAQQIAVAGDHGEDVVEVARHSARQAPHGVHLARVAELLFELAAAGDVAEYQDGALQPAALVAQRRGALLDGNLGLIAGDQQDLAHIVGGGPRADGIPGGAAGGFAAAFFDDLQDLAQRPAQGVGAPPSGQGFGHRIEECDALFAVGGHHAIGDTRQRGGQHAAAAVESGDQSGGRHRNGDKR